MNTKSYILLTLLYSTSFLKANEYIAAVKYSDLERIEELNQGYEDININAIDDKTGLTPLQYASLYNPGVIKSLINNSDLNIYKHSKTTKQSALNILLNEIEAENDEQRIKAIIEIINFEKNKDFPNWDKLFKSNNEDLIYKMIDKNLYMAIYFIYKNNIEINNKKYIEYSMQKNPAMIFYFKKLNDKHIYNNAIKKLIKNDKRFDIKMLLTDGKLYEYLEIITKIKETRDNTNSINIIKSYHKEYFKKLYKVKKQNIKNKLIVNTVVVTNMVDLKLKEYKYKLNQFKNVIEKNKIDNLKLLQNLEITKKNQELEIYKYKSKYDKRLYLLRIDKEKQCDRIIQKIKIKNIKLLEKAKLELNKIKSNLTAFKKEKQSSNTIYKEKIKEINKILTFKDKEIKSLTALTEGMKKLEEELQSEKEKSKKSKINVFNYLYLSLFFITLNILSLYLLRKYFKKTSITK